MNNVPTFTIKEAREHLKRKGLDSGAFYYNVFYKKYEYYTLEPTEHTKKTPKGKLLINIIKAK